MPVLTTFHKAIRICCIMRQNKTKYSSLIICTKPIRANTTNYKFNSQKSCRKINIKTPKYHFNSFAPTIQIPINSNTFEKEDIYLKNTRRQLAAFNTQSDLSKLSVTFYDLLNKLNKLKSQFNDDNKWQLFIEFVHQQHPQLLKLCHQDPFTKRCFHQPRGYAGDAVTLDMIYKQSFTDKNISLLGQQIFQAFMHEKSPEAVRERAQFIGKYIDGLYETEHIPLNVLNIACGHLREVESCRQFWRGNINVFGMDQDVKSLGVVKKDYIDKGYNVEIINGKIKKLFDPNYSKELLKVNDSKQFDLIWSAGLYDYLNDKSSKLLTKKLFDMVKPNGKLLIGNCFSNLCCGYMECFMNWTLIYRNIDEIRAFGSEIDANEIQ
eukprot:827506_1